MRRSRPLALTFGALAGLALLAGCTPQSGERPSDAATSVPPPSQAPTQEAPEGAPENFLVDSSPGGPQEGDPLWQLLAETAGSGDEVYLKVAFHNYSEPTASEGQVTVLNDIPDSVSVTVDEAQVTPLEPTFYVVTGTFTVEEVGSSAYTLETVDGEEIPELNLEGDNDEARCSPENAQETIMEAVEQLRSNPDERDNMRRLWGAAPAVWWAIQASAQSLDESDGDSPGDTVLEACEPYLS